MMIIMLDDDDDGGGGYGGCVLLEGGVDSPRQAFFSLSCSWLGSRRRRGPLS